MIEEKSEIKKNKEEVEEEVKEDEIEKKETKEEDKDKEPKEETKEEEEKKYIDVPQEIQRFLENVPYDIRKEKVPQLPVQYIVGLSPEDAKKLDNTLGIRKIVDLTLKSIPKEKVHMLNVLGISEDILEKWQSIGSYIIRVVKGTVEKLEKKTEIGMFIP